MEDFFNTEEEDFDLADENELICRYENMQKNHHPAFFSVDDFEQLYFHYENFLLDSLSLHDMQLNELLNEQLKKGGAVIKAAIAQYPDAEILQLLQVYHSYRERRISKKALVDKMAKVSYPDYEQEHFKRTLAYIYAQIGERKKALSILNFLLENTDDEEDKLLLYYEMLFLFESADEAPKAVEYCNNLLECEDINQGLLFTDMYWHFLLKPIAIPVFELLAQQYTFSMDAWLYLGKAYFDMTMLDKAIQAFKYSAAVSNHPLPLISLGRIYVISEKIPEALECFQEAIQLDPTRSGLYTEMGEILYNADDAQQAMRFFSMAIDADKKDANALLGMALALSSLERYDDSVAYIMQAKKIDKLPIEALLLLADDYIELDKDEEALAIYQKMVKKYPKDVDVWLSYSNYYAVIEDFEQACVVAKRGLEILPDNPYLLYRIANYCFLGKYTWQGVTFLQMAYHINADLLDFFSDYDENVMKIPEVIEMVNNEKQKVKKKK